MDYEKKLKDSLATLSRLPEKHAYEAASEIIGAAIKVMSDGQRHQFTEKIEAVVLDKLNQMWIDFHKRKVA
jgi:hypothetical protein